MASTGKCPFCGAVVTSDQKNCPECGGVHEHYIEDRPRQILHPKTIDELKKKGLWFACADMGGEEMYRTNLQGPIGLVIGNEGSGVSRLVREKCDFTASIPMKGDIDSLNASVAAGVLAYEIVRQRREV